MADWVKCTPLGQTKRSIYINVERIVAVADGENGSTVIYGGQNGTDRGEIAARLGGCSWAVKSWLMPP